MKALEVVDRVGRGLQNEWVDATDTRPLEPRAMVAVTVLVIAVPVALLVTGTFELVASVVAAILLAAAMVVLPFAVVDETLCLVRRRRRRRFEASWPTAERIDEAES